MHDTYIQSEKQTREQFQEFADNIIWSNDDGSEKYIGIGNMADWWIERDRLSLIKQFQAYVKELEGKWMEFDPEKMEGIFHDPSAVQGYSTGLQLSIDKANNFIKYLEQR